MHQEQRPPTGTVTCLFSDIEGSTRLELALGTGPYRDVRERHRELLRAAFAAHDGYEQSTEGDSFFVLFRRAGDAVAAATDGQRALAGGSWPDGVEIRVRMGLHTGEIETVGSDVIGYDINRTARIAGIAHGGQVLLSDATAALVGETLPAGVTLLDLGRHRLKDLREPEHLSQLVIDGLQATFPPLRSLDNRPNNLPTQLTTFVGREREVGDALALLRSSRLLTLTGPGGTGKTRLSLQVAAEGADDFPDGVWFVALDAVRDPALVVPTIARTLGLAENAGRPSMDVLVDEIGEQKVLLVLDNFEQVTDAGPDIAELLRRCPNLRALVTTRITLRVSGEQEYPVPGLPAPPDTSRLSEVERLNLPQELRDLDPERLSQFEAVRLFIARATAIRPSFAVTNANAPAVAGIAARLHGMPLALELAAARVKLLTPDQILARLEHHLDLLSAGSRDLPERQQTLRGAIRWSYDLLDDGARRLVDRLSVFRGGFDLEMAERVCGPADDVGRDIVERIGELVDQSIVRLDEGTEDPRFAMLETIREYAAEMLAERGETETIADRHAAAMLELAQQAAPELAGAAQRTWLDRLEREHDNLRAALDWSVSKPDPPLATRLATALWRFWQQRGYLNEARARFERLEAERWPLDPTDRARFDEAFGGVAYWQSDAATAKRLYEDALRIWRDLGDRREIANALYNRAYADMIDVMEGRVAPPAPGSVLASAPLLDEALDIYRELGDTGGEGNILWALGSLNYFTKSAADAESWYRRSLELHRSAGDRSMEAWSLHMLGLSIVSQRRFEEAREVVRHALRHFYEASDVSGVTLVLDDLGIIAIGLHDPVRAGRLWGAARHLQQRTGTGLANYVEQNDELYGVPTPKDALPADELATLAAEGAAMSLDEIVAYALEVPADSLPVSHVEVPS
ncbi:MAG TPA: tetratricopeptide repeat protein [Candidatus Limnocylindrales bacterium]|nr:tetratricopeptide repeat protein [Candidatus Limnocylindrales bacterium]